MSLRRGLMMGMAVGKVPRLIFNESITLEETAKSDSIATVQLPMIQNGYICILVDKYPSAPDPTIYIVLSGYVNIFGKYNNRTNGVSILRPNGTIGSDSNAIGYNFTTGVLNLGGKYGYYPEGMTYNIYAFEIADAD